MKTENKNDIKIKVTGWPAFVVWGVIPSIAFPPILFLYLVITNEKTDTSWQLSIISFIVLISIFAFFMFPYIMRVYKVVNNTLVCRVFLKEYIYSLDDIYALTKHKPNVSHSPAFVIFFKTPKEDEYIQVPVMCLLSKDSKRLYDILTGILTENYKTDPASGLNSKNREYENKK